MVDDLNCPSRSFPTRPEGGKTLVPQHNSAKQQTPKRKLPSLLPLFLEEHISGMSSTMYM
jgi:hypothetical protein